MGKVFEVIDGKQCATEVVDGTRVVRNPGYDYGLADDDTRITGVEHISVVREGTQGPFFTTPVANLREVE
jgi:hypothetical protein